MYGAYRNKKANGGLITGPGTGTSDSIQDEVPEGSYILPADTTQAMGFGARRRPIDGAPTAQPGFGAYRNKVPVNVSNGEFEVPPEQVQQLGAQVLDAVKAVTHTPTPEPTNDARDTFFANGGQVQLGVEGYRKGKAIHEARSQVPNYGNFGAYRDKAKQGETPSYGNFGVRRKNYANGGLVDDPLKPKQTSFDVTNTPAAAQQATGLPQNPAIPGNQARAQQMQSQFNQPVTGPRGPVGQPAAPAQPNNDTAPTQGVGESLGRGLGGAGKAVGGALLYAPAAAADGVRNLAGWAAGGDTSQIKPWREGPGNLAAEGWGEMSAGAAGLRDNAGYGTRQALGIDKAPMPPTAGPAGTSNVLPPAAAPTPGDASAQQPAGQDGWARTGFGVQRQGGEIAARVGPSGQAEFSNDAATVASAVPNYGNFGARRPAAAPAAQPGYGAYRRTPEQLAAMRLQNDQDLAATGSAANLGNGVGTFSQAQAGDAQLALDRFERANQQRQQMVETAHRGELGNNGGQLTVVRDSTRAPSDVDIQNARLEERLANTDATRQQAQNSTALANQRVASEAQRMGTEALNQQRLQQQVQEGGYGLQDQQRIDGLKASMVDPTLTQAQREQARDTYINLITQPKDRYRSQDVILGRDENGRDIRGTQLIDVTTGQPVAGGTTQGAPLRRSVSRAEVQSAAKEDGVSVDDYIRALRAKGVMVS
ncbi:hypothetical protein [Pseudomonas sp. PI1]|uniref:hypothetical protein n=1 Tax=Pseudomonas sp. PI1 TaxID=1582493 RepID=UPI0005B9CC78|nr:hypothetical protein [Pseudomonas sp. PI1]KWR85526.1 hypothetical protein RN02_02400 [Pseudomonas sp. PI1]